jgi:hypothetical protein
MAAVSMCFLSILLLLNAFRRTSPQKATPFHRKGTLGKTTHHANNRGLDSFKRGITPRKNAIPDETDTNYNPVTKLVH